MKTEENIISEILQETGLSAESIEVAMIANLHEWVLMSSDETKNLPDPHRRNQR